MEAFVLAGGYGRRLASVVSDVPKPMAPVHGKPLLHYLVQYLAYNAVSRIVFCCGYLHEAIERYFGAEFHGITIDYSVEREPLGTGGALVNALHLMREEVCLVLNGDSFFKAALGKLLAAHKDNNSDVTIALKEQSRLDRYGAVRLQGNRIIAFSEKQSDARGLANGGVYVVRKSAFQSLVLPKSFSLEKDFLERYCGQLTFTGVIDKGYFIDIGTPEDYQRAQVEFRQLEYV
jgi:D-glycero-alpha-D-manno-heptose 1-phosphate guanylyltransferase